MSPAASAAAASSATAPRARLTHWLCVDDDLWRQLLDHGRRGPACPSCWVPMRTFPLKGVTVDGCPGCGALLLDSGELSALTGLVEGPPPSAPTRAPTGAEEEPRHDPGALGRVYTDAEAALPAFLGELRWLQVSQHRQFAEALLSLEFGNRYSVRTPNRGVGSIVVEEGLGAQIVRMFAGGLLRSRYVVRDPRDNPVLVPRRSFEKLVLPHLEVATWTADDDGRVLGTVERSFRLASTAYELKDASGRVFARLERPALNLWQFRLCAARGDEVGAIAKQWAGLATEWFSDADDFGVDFGEAPWTVDQRAVLLGAALAIDLDCFERKGRGNSSLADVLR